MTAAQDAARRVQWTNTACLNRDDVDTLARFTLAVCEPDEALVETVAQALCQVFTGLDADWRQFVPDARAALAAVAQAAGAEHG